jgi:hypothetical protein
MCFFKVPKKKTKKKTKKKKQEKNQKNKKNVCRISCSKRKNDTAFWLTF